MAEPILSLGRCEDLSGRQFGRLTASSFAGRVSGRTLWKCVCDCGKAVVVEASSMKNGHTKSCGCRQREDAAARFLKHGKSYGPEYRAWAGLAQRCTNAGNPNYHEYGGRGITVCERWHNSFVAFFNDMGPRPSKRHSLDRKDNDKGYWCGKAECSECGPLGREPNCRWATKSEQQWNKRDTRLITFNGLSLPLKAWARRIGIHPNTLRGRLKRWPVERALTEPVA